MSSLDKDKLKNTEVPEEMDSGTQESEALTLEDLERDVTTDATSFTATWHFEFDDILKAIEHMDQAPDPKVEIEVLDDVKAPAEPEAGLESKPELYEEPEPEEASETEPLVEEPAESDEVLETEIEPEPENSKSELVSETPVEESEPELESESESTEKESETQSELETETAELTETEPEPEGEAENANAEPEPETPATPEEPTEPAEPETPVPAKARKRLFSGNKGHDSGNRKLVVTDIILLAIIVISIVAGLAVAHSLVNKANAANEQKIAEMKANVKEVNLAESLYDIAADKVVADVAVPTYTLEELYALDLREPTGFTAKDLEMITRKGLVGCEEAFVKAEETYGVNSIFLMSIASLESAYGTMMFRPNNMFGYGRSGFSSKQEGIMTVAKGLGTRYLPPGGSLYGGSPTLKGVNKRYAANPQWYYKVGKYMQGYYEELAAEKNGALDKFE